jgi:hypothetical protein
MGSKAGRSYDCKKEIINTSTNQSIFTWETGERKQNRGRLYHLLADSPNESQSSSNTQSIKEEEQSFQLTNRELSIHAPVYRVQGSRDLHVAILAWYRQLGGLTLGMLLKAMTLTDYALTR